MLEKDRIAVGQCLHAINHIFQYTKDIKDLEQLLANDMAYDAVQMNFIVLGETATKLSDDVRNTLPHIDWRAVKGFRNIIAHEYFGVDENIVWAAIKHHLPQLKADLEGLLAK